jgi:nitrate/nitrite-specific signal transduction histidine kinase
MSDERKTPFGRRGEEFLAIFQRGAQFTKELMQENQRLRRDLGALQDREHFAAQDDVEWDKLRQELLVRIESLEGENTDLRERLRSIEAENRQFAERYLEIEEENNNLANLYVASFQLHSTLDPGEVVKAIIEIVINLIGADVFCVYVANDKTRKLEPVASEGEAPSAFPVIPFGDGMVGRSLGKGETACRDIPAEAPAPSSGEDPVVSIPLSVQDKPVGAIAIYSLLQQKDGFSPLDHELFTLLAGHAATAIFASQLYSQSERKLNTIQGFIDLLTK